MEITKLRQQMAGHALPSTSPQPAVLAVDRRARLTKPPAQETQAAGEILSQGGLPVQALVVICGLPQLPDDGAVQVGSGRRRMYAGAEEHLVAVDVAQAANVSLVE
jgi:hypothetical protein